VVNCPCNTYLKLPTFWSILRFPLLRVASMAYQISPLSTNTFIRLAVVMVVLLTQSVSAQDDNLYPEVPIPVTIPPNDTYPEQPPPDDYNVTTPSPTPYPSYNDTIDDNTTTPDSCPALNYSRVPPPPPPRPGSVRSYTDIIVRPSLQCRLQRTNTVLGYQIGSAQPVYQSICSGFCINLQTAAQECIPVTREVQVSATPNSFSPTRTQRTVSVVTGCQCQAAKCVVNRGGVITEYEDGQTVIDQCDRVVSALRLHPSAHFPL